VAFAVWKQCSGPDNLGVKSQFNLGVPVTAAIKRMKISAEVNDSTRLVSLHNNRLTAAVAYVLACIASKGYLYVLGFLIGLVAIPMSVPAVALDSKQAVNRFYHTSWTAKDGLPGAVLSLAQTTDGFLWIGGSDGLFRFDGLAIERYTPQNGSLLHDTVLVVLLATPDGGLWIGYNQGGASFLKNGKVTNFTEDDGLPTGQTRCIAQDKDGVIWAAFVGGLARFDGTHWQKIQMDWNYPGKTASSVIVDHAGTVWVASEDRIFFLPRGGRLFQDAGLSVTASMLVVAPDNVLWLTEPRENSMGPLRMQAGLLKRSLTKIEVSNWSPIFDHNGGLWIGSWGDGILHIPFPNELREGTFSKLSPGAETFTETEGLSDNHATTWLEDREGNIWIGTNAGLDRLRYRNLSWFALRSGTHDFSLIPGAQGEMFVTSENGETVRVPQGAPLRNAPRNIMLAYRDPDGVIWLNCFDGDGSTFHGTLFQWKDAHFTKVAAPQDLENIHVRAMTKDSAGNLWISVISKGIYKFRNGVWTHIDVFKDNPTASASAAVTDSRDRIWLAFPRRKQVAVLTEGAVRSFSTEKDLSIGQVSLLARSGEQIWAAGGLGIAVFQGDEFHTVKADDGSTFADVDRVVATALDGVWLSAHRGIVHIPEGDVEHVVSDPSYKVTYEMFDELSDLPDPLQAAGSGYISAVQGSDGLLWFATRNGVARIDPQKISKNRLAPPVSIRSLSADGKGYVFDTSASLPALTKDLRVEYTALSLSIPERVRFRYKLDGWDQDWQDAGARREAFYTNLAPGTYRFHVTACNNDGVWNDVGATLDFSVAPAWYQTNWFRLLCVVSGLFVVWTVYRLRVRQIASGISARFDERLAERTRMARELHDTFLQTIQGSKLVADDALDHFGDPVRMQRAIQQLSVWLGQATQEGRAALNSLRTSTMERNDLAEAFRRATEDGLIPGSMAVTFSVIGDSREMHPIVRDEVYRIGYEAIRNAWMHSAASLLEVELRYAQDLAVRVSDNGIGIDRAVLNNGKDGHFGLSCMRERAVRIGGKLTVVSSATSGTEITVVVPGGIVFRKGSATLFSKLGHAFEPKRQRAKLDS
jgi:signal transduction histidine kinase/ligand-binding sensor domain-containing protein